ncbi:DUF4129 domain-containing protein [Thermococcus sp.]|uniref:DUF4129 domain-containing protein n=1 Tax=Thermococcus sp. TaxID=35749 RepID=UPI00261B9DC3|nr:DUF4129 domain-containing protein [Thermococcus sp.]
MSTKVKFVTLLTITVILMSLLMNSYSFSAPHKKNPEALDFLTVIILIGVFVGLIMLIVLAIYLRDLPSAKKEKVMIKGVVSLKSVIAFLFSSFLLGILFKIIFVNGGARTLPNVTNCTFSNATNVTLTNGTLTTNCTVVPSVGPLAGGNGNYTKKFLNHPVMTHLWLVFLLPILLGLIYLGYYYLKLVKANSERRKKLGMAMEFDKKLDEFGLEKFSDPREAIVEIYKNAVLWLEGLGIPYRESWTHWEHAEHVKYMHEAFVELTKLFEKAKYAPERIGWSDAEKALEIYNQLRRKASELAEMD